MGILRRGNPGAALVVIAAAVAAGCTAARSSAPTNSGGAGGGLGGAGGKAVADGAAGTVDSGADHAPGAGGTPGVGGSGDGGVDHAPDAGGAGGSGAGGAGNTGAGGNTGCAAGMHMCTGGCVKNTDVANCGTTSCTACAAPGNGNATCDGAACGFTCINGTTACSNACVSTASDPANCGACGHGCQGAMCVSGVCQGRVIATIPFAGENAIMALAGNKLYVEFVGRAVVSGMNVYEAAIDGSEANGTLITGAAAPFALDGKLYWQTSASDGSSYTLVSCTITNCAATIAPVVTRPLISGSVQVFTSALVPDPSNHQIVILENQQIGTIMTEQFILRVSPTGAVTQVAAIGNPTAGSIYTPNNRPDRFFWFNQSGSGFVPAYVPTSNTTGTTIALVPSMLAGSGQQIFANDTTAYWAGLDASFANPKVDSAPLPNGISIGNPNLFYTGAFTGVVDNTTAFGTFSTTASDAVSRCSLAVCSPVAIARGQSSPFSFLTDDTQVYWLTVVSATTTDVYAAVK